MTESTQSALGADVNRRRFLVGSAGVVGLGVIAAACGSDDEESTDTTAKKAKDGAAGDLAVATTAAGLEALAVGTYEAGLKAATAGDLGEVPPAVAEYATVAKKQHQEQLDAWNMVLTANNKPEVTEPNADLKPVIDEKFGKVKDVTGLAELALELEGIASATYLKVIPSLTGKDAINLAGSIQIIDMQHQAVLLFALGRYPVPKVFATTVDAVA